VSIIKRSNYLSVLSIIVAVIVLFVISQYNYLLAHIIIEFGISTIGIMIFSVSINSKKFNKDNILVLMGPGFLVSALLGILHTIAYKGMNIFGFVGGNAAIQFWIVLSYILAVTFLIAIINYSKKIKYNLILMLNLIIAIVSSYLIFSNNFPVCYIEGVGLTLFKRVSEYIIIAIYLFSLFKLSKLYSFKKINEYVYDNLKIIIVMLILGEASFTLYFDAHGFFNILGHFFKFIGFIVMYNSLLYDLIINPYKRASYNNKHDYLTGLFNRKYFDELLNDINKKENIPLGIIMVDVNTLKLVNDAYGNEVGDEILKNVAKVLSECATDKNCLSRYGGDEFVVIFPNCLENDIDSFINEYREKLKQIKIENINIETSSGFSIKNSEEESVDKILMQAEDDMNRNKLINRTGIRADAVNAILKTLHEKNPREELHSERVSEISYIFGEKLGLSDREKDMLKMMGLLHDVGKIALDEKILNKAGKLTDEEYEEIKKHPEIGYRILSSSNNLSEIAESVLSHHERWDGKGYPRGLYMNEIPYLSRILTITDSYDAMTSNRTYRDRMKKEEVINELKKCSGTQFDPELISTFLMLLEENIDL
jgi:diguanylate cyclase (GGDEF)-like protein